MTSEVTHQSFRATWTPPAGTVDNYRVVYEPVSGGPSQEVRERLTRAMLTRAMLTRARWLTVLPVFSCCWTAL